MHLSPHRVRLALINPQIAPNTGNIARLCVATGTALHLVRPLGFVLDDKKLRRSAMDYWPRLQLTLHDDADAFITAVGNDRVWLLENDAPRSIWQADFADGDWLLLGSETAGLPRAILDRWPGRLAGIPQVAGERCLNVATAAGIGLMEALRQVAPVTG